MNTVLNLLVHTSPLLGVAMIVVVARSSRSTPVRSAFLFLLGIVTIWNIGAMLELDVRLFSGDTYMPLVNLSYIGICLVPVAILYLGKVMLQPDWRPGVLHGAFLLIPVVSILMVYTNPLHHLFFVHFSLYSSEAVYGAYYYFHSLYSYSCIGAGILLMYISSARYSGFFSRQSLLIVIGVFLTLIPNLLFSFGVGNLPFGISSAAFTVSILCFAVSFFKYRFIEAQPITLKQIMDLVSDGYMVVDKQLRILSYNRALLDMFPDPGGIVLGEDLSAFVNSCFPEYPYERFLALHAQSKWRQETITEEIPAAGGIYVSMEITPVARRNTNDSSIILLKDITKSKLLIEATQAASQAKGDFLSYMSHEIRTPLNAIIGMTAIGKTSPAIERKNYALERIESASAHLLGIVNDILDISKIEAGKFELYDTEIRVEHMLKNVVDVANARAEEKKQTLTVNLDEHVPACIEGDELRLSQVITNLLSNAVKFTPENGAVALRIEKESEEGEEITLRIEVADTGIGISKEQQDRLFVSYNQADAGIAQTYGGTGLGLSISKQIVDLMGGKIWVESELGHGSRFIFTMKTRELALRPSANPATASGRYDFHHHTLLIVEDIEINREILGSFLEETGVSLDYAENGKAAVSMFHENPWKYSAILMDIQMPEMDGYEATRTIRALDTEHAQSIPIIAMTANVFKEDIEKCLAAGMNSHIGKPVDTEVLLETLNHYLG